MFWDIFSKMCKENNVSPSAVCLKIGLSNAAATHWKKGSVPSSDSLQKVADYFECSVEHLLGKDEQKKNNFDMHFEEIDYEAYQLFQQLTSTEKEEVLKFIKFTLSNK